MPPVRLGVILLNRWLQLSRSLLVIGQCFNYWVWYKNVIIERIKEAAQFVDINQLCISPQCGFASTEEGNILTEEAQWAKLDLIKEIADEVWGN